MKAINLDQAVQFFDPREALTGQHLQMWFVQRQHSPRKRLQILLKQPREDGLKALFVGHRGSGKSTELNVLAREMANDYYAISFDALEIIGRATMSYEDLMLALSTQVTRKCIEASLINRPLTEPLLEGWRNLADWWRQVVAGLDIGREREVSTYASFSTLLGEIELGVNQSPFTREQLNDQVDRQMPELIRRLNWVIEETQQRLNPKRLLLIIEGTDKIDLEAGRHIFRDHASTITAPKATMIFTFPLALRYSADYETIRRAFQDQQYLPNLALRDHDGHEDTAGAQALRTLVLNRLESGLIETDALNHLISSCGGIPSDLVKMVRASAIYALERDEQSARIEVQDAQNAVKDLRRELAASLTMEEWKILAQRHADRRLSSESEIQVLLYKGALIEYSNGVPWCDVHPALWSLLDQYAG